MDGLVSRPIFRRLAALVFVAFFGPLHAATLSGIVDDGDEAMANVELLLVNADNNTVLRTAYSGSDGSFRFSVGEGRFNIGAFKTDYTTQWIQGIAVEGSDVSVHIELVPEAFAEDHSGAWEGDCD